MIKNLGALICFMLISAGNIFAADKTYPERVVSLGSTITEKIYLLGAGDRLVANTNYCVRPPEAKHKEKIGTIIKSDIEKIFSLKPDLVLATSLTQPRQIKKMERLGLKVVVFQQPANFNEMFEQFLELGKLLGERETAEEIIGRAKKQISGISNIKREGKKPKVFFQIGARPLFTATGESFVNDFIKYAGGVNIAADAKSGMYSREKVVEADPDVIIIITMGIIGEQEMETWKNYKSMSAVKTGRIYIIDSYIVCSPTPESLAGTLNEISEIFYPAQKGGVNDK
jgi:iron complex transport system substrate-binding protein